MNLNKLIYCSWESLLCKTERHLENDTTISIAMPSTNKMGRRIQLEVMIFLSKYKKTGFEVRIYKTDKNDTYVPHEEDKIKRYVDNNEYISFFFTSFGAARDFVSSIPKNHPEYQKRKIRKPSLYGTYKLTYLGDFYPS